MISKKLKKLCIIEVSRSFIALKVENSEKKYSVNFYFIFCKWKINKLKVQFKLSSVIYIIYKILS